MNPTFMLGAELEVRRLGFGAMRIVDDREEGVRVVRRAVELGVNFIDTADIYGAGRSEEIIAEALHPYPEGLVITTKGGLGWGLQERIRDGRPEHLREACDASLRGLTARPTIYRGLSPQRGTRRVRGLFVTRSRAAGAARCAGSRTEP